jgi:hypothetical protein
MIEDKSHKIIMLTLIIADEYRLRAVQSKAVEDGCDDE